MVCEVCGGRGDGVTRETQLLSRQLNPDVIVRFGKGHLSLNPYYGARTRHVWVHNWALANDRERLWFNTTVACRIEPGGEIHFVGWDGSVVTWVSYNWSRTRGSTSGSLHS